MSLVDGCECVLQNRILPRNETGGPLRILNAIFILSNQPIRRLLPKNVVVALIGAARVVIVPELAQVGCTQVALEYDLRQSLSVINTETYLHDHHMLL